MFLLMSLAVRYPDMPSGSSFDIAHNQQMIPGQLQKSILHIVARRANEYDSRFYALNFNPTKKHLLKIEV